ncbi:class I SAM-dependent methyltransferase, partial [Clostridium perfringens]|nr:class I SAM-dependent methyltransferase [Clostridium perfringens]
MTYGEFAKIYDELINEDINYQEMCDRIIDICKDENISFNNYLAIACGTGNVTVKLAKNFKESFAVDLSDDMLR